MCSLRHTVANEIESTTLNHINGLTDDSSSYLHNNSPSSFVVLTSAEAQTQTLEDRKHSWYVNLPGFIFYSTTRTSIRFQSEQTQRGVPLCYSRDLKMERPDSAAETELIKALVFVSVQPEAKR